MKDPSAWGAQSDNAKTLAGLLGGKAEEHAETLKTVAFVPAKLQASEAWLGGGDKSGVAKILKDTAGTHRRAFRA